MLTTRDSELVETLKAWVIEREAGLVAQIVALLTPPSKVSQMGEPPTALQHETPLTPAQVEMIKAMAYDRREELLLKTQALIDAAVGPLHAQVSHLTDVGIQFGQRVALRANAGSLLCAEGGGPTVDGEPFLIRAASHVGPWEGFTTERG